MIDFLLERFARAADKEALVWRDRSTTYGWLLRALAKWRETLDRHGIAPGDVVVLRGDFSPQCLAAFLALVERRAIVVPLTEASTARLDPLLDIAQAEWLIEGEGEPAPVSRLPRRAEHPLYTVLKEAGHPGLVLFSSGSTGEAKGIVHDVVRLLGKFRKSRRDLRTLAFLHFDHIGGVDTLFYCLSNGSTIIVPADRSPEAVCAAVARHRVQVLPVAPSFLNLLLLSGAHQRHDLSSLEVITYGAEVMPDSLLRRCAEVFPGVDLVQRYGATEVGSPRSRSKRPDSPWVKLGGEGWETRVVDGKLEIKAQSAMLGYLNAENPFTEDGWFRTGDAVLVDGEYIRILGRESDLINVGGEKVYPAEVESVIRELPNVADVAVFGEPHILLGQIVCARVQLLADEDESALAQRIQRACRERLERYKVPLKVLATKAPLTTARFKTDRKRAER